ncbi:hypothetical protein BDZ85DRAFT_280867 [Elsinoe ampelina]|uniref:AB hydrolase-1 domain-containing protein n=1 Tax=Elsinoe ampelina TaxID=302913 RepID=A0A6A6GF65_9PEZI|nr:hypothetical protein BDZ85DRAFT_280867 [Elsinoe ampelina]
MAGPSRPPPKVPPRHAGGQGSYTAQDAPPPYSSFETDTFTKHALDIPFAGKDLRRRSTDSLRPPGPEEQHARRRLLLVYIHGFQGNERSFQSFPAHVHNVVTMLLSESHVVHSKIYPRYRSKKHITVARDDFSRWLAPHEDEKTDVILFGHSMGGLLSAEVAVMPADDGRSMRHRILGTINFDVPFLGMHPGVIKAGLSSIFAPSPDTPAESADTGQIYLTSPNASEASIPGVHAASQPTSPAATNTSNPLQSSDPNFNPAFENDVILPMRKGWMNAWHFVNKHSDNLFKGTKQLIKSHVEFAGGMADYSSLRARYAKIRSLDVADDQVRASIVGNKFVPPRKRFVNYYTASTGRPKREKLPAKVENTEQSQKVSPAGSSRHSLDPGDASRGRLKDDNVSLKPSSAVSSRAPSAAASPRISLNEHTNDGVIEKDIKELNLDDSPVEGRNDTPTMPPADGSATIGSDQAPTAEQRQAMEATVPRSRDSSPGPSSPDLSRYKSNTSVQTNETQSKDAPVKPKKDRKFCALPPKDSQGNRDPVWVRVFMKDVDEVAAHCGLFVESAPAYPSLVSDVAERVKEWVQDAESERVARELDAQYEY